MLREKFDHFPIWAKKTQHGATRLNIVAKRTQHVAPNNVAICCVEMLRSFGRGCNRLSNNRTLKDWFLTHQGNTPRIQALKAQDKELAKYLESK